MRIGINAVGVPLAIASAAVAAIWTIPSPLWASVVIAVLTGLVIVVAAPRNAEPTPGLEAAVARLTAGDTVTPIGGPATPLTRALEDLRLKLNASAEAEQTKRAEQDKGLEKSRKRMGLLLDFDAMAGSLMQSVTGSMSEARNLADGLTKSAQRTDDLSNDIAQAAERATSNLQTVASAAEQLSASTQEISRQVTNTSGISQRAVDGIADTRETVQSLHHAAQQIGTVITLISDIAGQTNLLALNATIEAARAGEAGKGFAVVANEVKHLANQTAKATGEIAQQVAGIQTSTQAAVEAIGAVTATINQVNDVVTSIASAVEEQTAATQEIARNVQEAAAGNTRVTEGISGVADDAAQAHHLAEDMTSLADRLSSEAGELRHSVEKLLADIKAV